MTTIAKVLALLEENQSVSLNQFLSAGLYKAVSRISDLRLKRGYCIECTDKHTKNPKYTLISKPIQSTIPLSPNLYA